MQDTVYPYQDRDLPPVDEKDAETIREQKRQAKKREATLKNNYLKDLAKVKQKNEICQNWHHDQVNTLGQKLKKDSAVLPEIGTDYSKTPNWDVYEGQSNFRGISQLCEE